MSGEYTGGDNGVPGTGGKKAIDRCNRKGTEIEFLKLCGGSGMGETRHSSQKHTAKKKKKNTYR